VDRGQRPPNVLERAVASRTAQIHRKTNETEVQLELGLDGGDVRDIRSPLPFVDHMLDAFARHGLFDVRLRASGDIEVDGHHTVEDIGLALGMGFRDALGDRAGIVRYGAATIPMDETLASCAVDFCGRPAFVWHAEAIRGRWIGTFDCDLAKEFFAAFASRAECNLHVNLHYGENAHHIVEAIFKAFARACDAATRIDDRLAGAVPSTKGTLTA
jgi:imidazoleglycerol-phosphate dehydratase